MYRYNFSIASLFGLTTIVLSLAILGRSANARPQPLTNFVDLNQSRQFFENGQEQFEHEIEIFRQDRDLPEIKLPANCCKTENTVPQSLIENERPEIEPVSSLAIDNYYYLYSAIAFQD